MKIHLPTLGHPAVLTDGAFGGLGAILEKEILSQVQRVYILH